MKRLTKRIDGKAAFVHGTCYDHSKYRFSLPPTRTQGLSQRCGANYKQFEDEAMSRALRLDASLNLMEAREGRAAVVLPCNVGM